MGATPAPPGALVIFGVSGDLTRRKLLPALCHLYDAGLLDERFAIVGVARRPHTDASFAREAARDLTEFAPKASARARRWVKGRLVYEPGDFDDPDVYHRVKRRLFEVARERGTGDNALFYLATAPAYFAPIVDACAAQGLAREDRGYRRFVVEKPFGRDLRSARELNARLLRSLDESQIYRIDHYLGKETVQNLLAFRFGNSIFEPVWNRRYVDHVQITVAEDLGMEGRGGYYDEAGALRDMVPNHLFQLISLIAMEPPSSFEADAVRDEQTKVLRALQPLTPEDAARHVVRGQYAGYQREPRVKRGSRTETFVAMKLHIESWRWADVPFFIRTGKRLGCRSTEIVVQFRRAPLRLFRQVGVEALTPNQIVARLQPDEGIALSFEAKVPGPAMRVGTVNMDFRYEDYFGSRPSTGYERLLHDAMLGDATLFRRADALEAGWAFVEPIQRAWEKSRAKPASYKPGSWGPEAAQTLLGARWRRWRECAGKR